MQLGVKRIFTKRGARTAAAFVVAPILPGALVGAYDAINGDWWSVLWYLEFSAALGYPVAVVLGIPLHLLLTWKKLTAYPIYAGSGALLGVVAYLATVLPGILFGGAQLSQVVIATGALLSSGAIFGTIAASAFWLIARPDR